MPTYENTLGKNLEKSPDCQLQLISVEDNPESCYLIEHIDLYSHRNLNTKKIQAIFDIEWNGVVGRFGDIMHDEVIGLVYESLEDNLAIDAQNLVTQIFGRMECQISS